MASARRDLHQSTKTSTQSPITPSTTTLVASANLTRRPPRIAVLLPAFNEEIAITDTVLAFRAELPTATIYVYDNNSKDQTSARALAAGAVVRREPLQGKGHTVRRMFADIDADVYIMADADLTYDAKVAPRMAAELVDQNLDMLVGRRVHTDQAAYRRGHVLGNLVVSAFLAQLFGRRFTDIFSGYRAFSRRFVKSFPSLSGGFEIETELTVHALTLQMPIAEIDAQYGPRRVGSHSKLRTYRDGIRILRIMIVMFKNERPLAFFSWIAAALAASAVLIATPIFITYFHTGLVPRFPTAFLAASIMIMAVLSLACGLVLDTVTRGRREFKRLLYLQIPAPKEALESATSAPVVDR